MKIKILILTSIFFLNEISLYSQKKDTEQALYNIGFGAIFGTVGAIINKKKNESIGKVIKKSLWQGALGGYVVFESKRVLREAQRQNNWEYIWVSKLINAAGVSIIENTALNEKFGTRWHLNIGFNRIELNSLDKLTISYKLKPVAFVYTIDALFRHQFEFSQSIKTGQFVFTTNEVTDVKNYNIVAATYPGLIVYENNYFQDINLTTHEIIHRYQSNDFSVFNTYFDKPFKRLSQKRKIIKWIDKYLLIESHYLILTPLYILEGIDESNYYRNRFEYEAGYYSGTN